VKQLVVGHTGLQREMNEAESKSKMLQFSYTPRRSNSLGKVDAAFFAQSETHSLLSAVREIERGLMDGHFCAIAYRIQGIAQIKQ
jgi:hypothetical protein